MSEYCPGSANGEHEFELSGAVGTCIRCAHKKVQTCHGITKRKRWCQGTPAQYVAPDGRTFCWQHRDAVHGTWWEVDDYLVADAHERELDEVQGRAV